MLAVGELELFIVGLLIAGTRYRRYTDMNGKVISEPAYRTDNYLTENWLFGARRFEWKDGLKP